LEKLLHLGAITAVYRHDPLLLRLPLDHAPRHEHARAAAQLADAVVVGSAIVNAFHHNPHTPEGRSATAQFVAEMVRAVKAV